MNTAISKVTPQAHWLLRGGLASVFLFHGIGKLIDIGGFAEMMGLPYAIALLVTFAEVAAGIGIIVGGFGR